MDPARRATLWLLAMCAIWGSSFFSMKLGQEGLARATGPAGAASALLLLRFLAAAILFVPLFPAAVRGLTRGTVAWGLALSVPFYAGFLLQVMGLGETSSTVSAFLTNLTVVLTPLLGRFVFRESLSRANLAGAAVALAGVFVLTNPGGGGFGRGEFLTIGCAAAFAVQIQLTHVATRRASPEGVTFVMFVAATAYSAATLAALGVPASALVRGLGERHVAWTVLYNAVVCSVAAITIMNRFQREIPPTRAAVLYTLEPVFAAAFAAAAGEPVGARQAAGGAVIVGGNLLCEALKPRASGEEAPAPAVVVAQDPERRA
jgi:drug/metabolite transporter (DMT)-like permease